MTPLPNWKTIPKSERDDLLRRYVAEGLTASQIANRFQDCSRSAAIGRAHRLQLHLGGKSKKKSAKPSPAAKRAKPSSMSPGRKMKLIAGVPLVTLGGGPKASSQYDFKTRAAQRAADAGLADHLVSGEAKRPIDDFAIPVSRRLKLTDLTERTCKWPHGDPQSADFSFCGNEAGLDGPYCAYHARLSYNPISKRETAGLRSAERIR